MAGLRFKEDGATWKPVFNQFGLPVTCAPPTDFTRQVLSYDNLVASDAQITADPDATTLGGRVGWKLVASSASTSDASATIPLGALSASTEYRLEIDLGHLDCRYAAIDILNAHGATSTKTVYLDLQTHSVVSADAGLTVTVPNGGEVGYRYRIVFTTAGAVGGAGTIKAKLFMASSSGSKTFAGSVGDAILLGTDIDTAGTGDPDNESPENATLYFATAGTIDCCSECAAIIQCLKRIPLKFETPGVYVKDWLKQLPDSAYTCHQTSSTLAIYDPSGNDVDLIFDGTWIMPPKTATNDPWPGFATEFSTLSIYDDWVGATNCSWQSDGYRQLTFPAATKFFTPEGEFYFGQSRVYLYCAAKCFHNGTETVVQFGVYLKLMSETGDLADPYEAEICGDFYKYILYWPLFRTEEIPVAGLALADLVDMDAAPVAFDFTTAGAVPRFWLQLWGSDGSSGGYRELCTTSQSLSEDATCDGCCWWDDADARDEAPLPTPKSVVAMANVLSVLRTNCREPINCDFCPPPETPTYAAPRERVEVSFTHDNHCYMNFHAVIPACITNYEVFWSFGKTGDDVSHPLAGLEDGGLTPSEEISMVVLDLDTGCIYRAEETVDCACQCDGEYISMGYELLGVDGVPPEVILTTPGTCSDYPDARFRFRITASQLADPPSSSTCPSMFLEVQAKGLSTSACLNDDDCCPSPGPPMETCASVDDCTWVLDQGQSFEFTLGWGEVACFRSRPWDITCGCAGPWQYLGPFYIANCEDGSTPDLEGACDF